LAMRLHILSGIHLGHRVSNMALALSCKSEVHA